MHQSEESYPVDYKTLISLSKPNLCMDMSYQNILESIPETLIRINKYLKKKPYVNQLDLTGNGFNEHLASLEHLSLHLAAQSRVIYFLAQLPANIKSIKLMDFTLQLDTIWAIYLFCELQNDAQKINKKTDNWLQYINQQVWQNQNALIFIDRSYLPENLTNDCLLLLEKICFSKPSAFGFLLASWLHKGLVMKSFFNPNSYFAKFYYQQAKDFYQNNEYFNFNLPKESELKTSCWIKHGYCILLKNLDDISHFKRVLRKLQPMDILVIDIQSLELIEYVQKVLSNLKIPVTLMITGIEVDRSELYAKLLPFVGSDISLYLPKEITKNDALAICQFSHSRTQLELSANLDLEQASHLLKFLPSVYKVSPCSILDLESSILPILEELNKRDLISLPIHLSPYENIFVNDIVIPLLTRLPFLKKPNVLKLPHYLNSEEMDRLMPAIHSEHIIPVDAYMTNPELLQWVEKGFKLRLEDSFSSQQMEWLLSFNHPIKFEFSKNCSSQQIAIVCDLLIDDCIICIHPSNHATQIFDIANYIPAGVKVDIPVQMPPALAEHLMKNLPLSTEIITTHHSDERLLDAIARGRQAQFDQSNVVIHSIYRSSKIDDKETESSILVHHP